MRKTLVAFIAVGSLALVGCKKKPSVEELTKIKEEACACADKACAEKIDKGIARRIKGTPEGTRKARRAKMRLVA